MILRPLRIMESEIIFRSEDQWVKFDLPRQVGYKYTRLTDPHYSIDLEHEI